MRPYEEFKQAIRERENSGRYDGVNRFGFLGAYQFGLARLCDLGLTRRRDGTHGLTNSAFEFIPPMTKEQFLGSPDVQEAAFDRHVQDYARRLRLMPTVMNLSGAIAAAHLVGYQACLDYVHFGRIARDGNGVGVDEYFRHFEGYEIPSPTQPSAQVDVGAGTDSESV